MMKAGFIGLGSQGAPMAQRMIDAGYEVVLWARRSVTLEAFAATSAITAESVASLGAQVQYCGICVVDDEGVEQICGDLIQSMEPGGCIVIHSTVSPGLCQALAVKARRNKLNLIDAPVSGGGTSAAQGNLTLMVGGDAAVLAAVRPVLSTFAQQIFHLGDVGAGQMAKLVNNNLMAANLALAHHALAAAETLGIARDAFIELVRVSSGHSFSFDVRARMPDPSRFAHGAALLEKDVALLGEALGDDPDYQVLRDCASGFLAQARKR